MPYYQIFVSTVIEGVSDNTSESVFQLWLYKARKIQKDFMLVTWLKI